MRITSLKASERALIVASVGLALAAIATSSAAAAPSALFATVPTTPTTPVVVTGSATSVEATSAVLQGSVNPNEAEVVACQAEYGPTSAYGASAACEPAALTGHEPVTVSARATMLQPGAVYHFRFSITYATTGAGGREERMVDGEEKSFATLPTVTTSPPTVWLSYSGVESVLHVNLLGYVEAHGADVTSCAFEYGTSLSFGSAVVCSQYSGTSFTGSVSAVLSGLEWSSTYYVRVSASDSSGSSYGSVQAFQTPARIVYASYTPPPFTYTAPPAPYPTYRPPSGSVQPYVSSRDAAIARCMRLRGAARSRCLAALRRRRGGSGPATDRGLSVYYCPYGRSSRNSAAAPAAHAASTSEAGWPRKECLKMDKGPAGQHHTIVGMRHVHNWLLGGWGSDTIVGGEKGDVIWADYQACCWPKHQTAIIHAGNGRNVIYANDTLNYVWTGTNPRTVVHAHATGISGVIHCQSSAIVVYLSTTSERHFALDGCHHISHYSVGY